MGQYFNGIVLHNDWKTTKKPIRAALSPYDFDNGAKLMEHSYVRNNYVGAFLYLIDLLDDSEGVPCVWGGDYADTIGTDGMPFIERLNDAGRIETDGGFHAHYAANEWMGEDKKSKDYLDVLDMVKESKLHHYSYIINRTKKQYVEVPKNVNGQWIIHPLPILLADSNGRGLGDYEDEYCTNPEEKDVSLKKYEKKHNAQFVGTWAYDSISVTNCKGDTEGYTRIDWAIENEFFNDCL